MPPRSPTRPAARPGGDPRAARDGRRSPMQSRPASSQRRDYDDSPPAPRSSRNEVPRQRDEGATSRRGSAPRSSHGEIPRSPTMAERAPEALPQVIAQAEAAFADALRTSLTRVETAIGEDTPFTPWRWGRGAMRKDEKDPKDAADTEDLVAVLAEWWGQLVRFNDQAGFTALSDPGAALELALDALVPVSMLAAVGVQTGGGRLLDVGSGNGSPGVPWHLGGGFAETVLADARRRKMEFLDRVVKGRFPGVRAVHARLQPLPHAPLVWPPDDTPALDLIGEGFDVVVSKATFTDAGWLRALPGLLTPTGVGVWMRGEGPLPPLAREWQVRAVLRYRLPGLDRERRAWVLSAK